MGLFDTIIGNASEGDGSISSENMTGRTPGTSGGGGASGVTGDDGSTGGSGSDDTIVATISTENTPVDEVPEIDIGGTIEISGESSKISTTEDTTSTENFGLTEMEEDDGAETSPVIITDTIENPPRETEDHSTTINLLETSTLLNDIGAIATPEILENPTDSSVDTKISTFLTELETLKAHDIERLQEDEAKIRALEEAKEKAIAQFEADKKPIEAELETIRADEEKIDATIAVLSTMKTK